MQVLLSPVELNFNSNFLIYNSDFLSLIEKLNSASAALIEVETKPIKKITTIIKVTLFWERSILYFRLPVLSVCPTT